MAVYTFTGSNGDRISTDFSFALDSFEIQNNRARPTSTGVGESTKSVALLTGEADDTVSAIVNGRGVATKAFGVAFRMSSDGLNGFAAVINGSSGQLQLQRYNNSKAPTFTPRTYNIPSYDNSADYKITAEFSGNDIFVYLDDVEIESMRLTVGDGAYATNTLHGLAGSDSGLAEFDDFTVASQSSGTDPVDPPSPVDVIPINTPYQIQGMARKVTKLGKLFRRPSTMSHPEEYWTRCIHSEGLNNWPSERYPVIMYSSTDHDTGDGGIWVRVYDKEAGAFTDGSAWFEWDDISSRPEFSHITQKTNPIVTAGSGQQMETPQPRIMPDGSLRVYFHMQGAEIFGGGPTMQGTKYIGMDNGIDRTQTGIVTETEYDFRYRTGNGHSGYFEVGENTISDIPFADIGVCLQGGGNENVNNGQQILGSNDFTSWDYLAYYRRFNLDLMEFNGAGESDYVYPLDVIQGAKREGNYWRIIGKYRPQSGGGAEAGTRPVEWLVDSKFRAVSAPNFYFPLGASGEFDESEIITPQEFVYDNVVYLFYKTVESDNQSSIGLATVIDEPKTWDIHHPYNDMANVYEALSNGSMPAAGLTFNQAVSAKTEAAMSLTSLTMPSSGADATAISDSSFTLADYQHSLAEFEYIGKDTGDPVELEFGLVDDISSPANKMSVLFPARVASEQSTLIRCNVLGSTSAVDDTVNQYVGQDESVDARNGETVTAKHIFSLRVSPARDELAVMSGSSVVGKFDISGIDYGAIMSMFIKARLTDGSQATDETVSFGALRFKSFNSNVVNLISAPSITTSKTTDSVTVSTNSVAGATSYKYYLNGIEQNTGLFTDLEPETEYTVYARASNALGDSEPSTIQTVTTDAAEAPDTTAPVVTNNGPATLTITVGDTYTPDFSTNEGTLDIDNPVDTSTAGTYTVTATATDAAGNVGSATQTVIVEEVPVNQPPIANAGPDQSVAAATQFTLDGTGSQDTDGTIIEWRWTQTAGDTVTLNLEDPARPTATSPSKTTAQRLTFQLVTVDDEDAVSSPSLVNIDVAAVVQNDVLNIIDKISFTFESDGMITAFPGRANRETFRLKPSDPTGLVLEDGWFDFEANDVRRVEISMLETTGVKIISTDTDSITRERSKLHVRMGDMPIKSSTKEFEPTVSVFVGDDERGVVMTAPGLSGAPKVKYYSTTARAV